MLTDEPWLYHAVLSPYLNSGLLDPLDLCRQVEARYRAGARAAQRAEGFIRQIIGWREYVRGIYWREGPDYVRRNHFAATRALPAFYWTGDTDMHCLANVIGQTLDLAYAHHIQRLMVTGNFALLIGADPAEVHRWYLEVYADAYEWVELPNTLGMSQFADGGLLGSKPYAASGAYIDRMSDYCRTCRYDPKQRVGDECLPVQRALLGLPCAQRGEAAATTRACTCRTATGTAPIPRPRPRRGRMRRASSPRSTRRAAAIDQRGASAKSTRTVTLLALVPAITGGDAACAATMPGGALAMRSSSSTVGGM